MHVVCRAGPSHLLKWLERGEGPSPRTPLTVTNTVVSHRWLDNLLHQTGWPVLGTLRTDHRIRSPGLETLSEKTKRSREVGKSAL